MKPGCPAAAGHPKPPSGQGGNSRLESLRVGTEGEDTTGEDVQDELSLAIADPGLSKGNAANDCLSHASPDP
jgi:hypothetical protein